MLGSLAGEGEIMTETKTRHGQCLCGAVKLKVTTAGNDVGACHCGTCRQWGGGPYFSLDGGSDVEINGEDALKVFSSSEWAERGFCKHCGSHLFYRLKGSGQTMVAVGLLDDQTSFELAHQVFVDKRPAFYELGNETLMMTEAEVFAKFGGS